jgi:hypothetical protein
MALPTTYLRYVLTSGTVATPTFAYGSIDLIAALNITHAEQLTIVLNTTTLTLTTDFTVDEGAEEITLVGDTAAALAVGDVLVIERTTKNDGAYVDFENNNALDSDDLDANNKQLLFLIQEELAQSQNSVTLDLVNDCFDAQDKRICNLADGIASTDAVNLRQLLSAVEGAETSTIDNVGFFGFTGDGVETAFTLTGAGVGFVDDEEIITFVGGIIQKPGTDFAVSAGDTANPIVTFTTAPPDAVPIYCFTISGVVRSILNAEIVDGSAIADDTLSLDAINFGTGVAKRFLVIDAAGAYALRVAVASDISDLSTVVKAYKLSDFAVPTANVSMNSNKITNLTAGSSSSDAVNKSQMDAAISAAVGSVNVGGVTSAGNSTTGTNSGSKARMYYAEIGMNSYSQTASVAVNTPTGGSVTVGNIRPGAPGTSTHLMPFLVPAGGGYTITKSAGATINGVTYQEYL